MPDRPSTVKERYIGRAQHRHPQQMIRVDYEDRASRCQRPSRRELIQAIARADAASRHRPHQRLRQGRLHARRCWRRSSPRRGASGLRDARRPDSRQRLSQVSRLLRHHAQPPRSGPGDRPRRCNTHRRSARRRRAAARAARPGSGHRHARQGRHGPGPPRRPARDLSDPAAAGLRHHRRRRHGDGRAGHGPGGRRRLRPGDPPGQHRRRAGSREDRRRHGDARRDPARSAARPVPATESVAAGQGAAAATRWCTSWTAAVGWASESPSPTAASTCCTPATCSICKKPAPRPTCWWSASTATPACARSKGRTGPSIRWRRGRWCWPACRRSIT